MSIVTGLLRGLKRDSRLVKVTDYENGFVQERYEYAGEVHTVDYFNETPHCITNETAKTQYTRSGTTRFKA